MGFSHSIWVVGCVSQKVVRYRSDSMGKGSVDGKVILYGSGSFIMGVVQTRDYCTSYPRSVLFFTFVWTPVIFHQPALTVQMDKYI